MKFEEFAEKHGFGLAIVVYEDTLDDHFWDSLIFEECLAVYRDPSTKSHIEERVCKAMEKFSIGFARWLKIYDQTDTDTFLKKTATKMLKKTARGYDQFMAIYKGHSSDQDTQEWALKKIAKTKRSFAEWYETWKGSSVSSKLKVLAVEKMAETAKTFDEKWTLRRCAIITQSGGKIATQAWTDIQQLAKKFEHWLLINNACDAKDKEMIQFSCDKLLTFDRPVEAWISLYNESIGYKELQATALTAIRRAVEIK